MRFGAIAIALLVFLAVAACGNVKRTDYFEEGVDSDVGGGSGNGSDAGAEQVEGDPCEPDAGPWDCDPLTGEGCEGEGVACDHGQHDGVAGFYCFVDCTEELGAPCMTGPSDGPWCAAGMTCRDGVCVRFCCSSDDCDAGDCEPIDLANVIGGSLGTCPAPEVDTDTDT